MFAHVGGVLATDLKDATGDLTALDSEGFWAVVVTYEGEITCARFGTVREAPLPYAPWTGPPRDAWTTSLDRAAYIAGVERIHDAIAEGTVYQANLCRVLSAPLPGADLLGLGNALAGGNPAPYAAVMRLPGAADRLGFTRSFTCHARVTSWCPGRSRAPAVRRRTCCRRTVRRMS